MQKFNWGSTEKQHKTGDLLSPETIGTVQNHSGDFSEASREK